MRASLRPSLTDRSLTLVAFTDALSFNPTRRSASQPPAATGGNAGPYRYVCNCRLSTPYRTSYSARVSVLAGSSPILPKAWLLLLCLRRTPEVVIHAETPAVEYDAWMCAQISTPSQSRDTSRASG